MCVDLCLCVTEKRVNTNEGEFESLCEVLLSSC